MAQELKVPFLGDIPMNGCIREYCDRGQIMKMLTEENPARDALRSMCQNVAMQVFKGSNQVSNGTCAGNPVLVLTLDEIFARFFRSG